MLLLTCFPPPLPHPSPPPHLCEGNAPNRVQRQLQRGTVRAADVLQSDEAAADTVQACAEIFRGEERHLRHLLAERRRALHTGSESLSPFWSPFLSRFVTFLVSLAFATFLAFFICHFFCLLCLSPFLSLFFVTLCCLLFPSCLFYSFLSPSFFLLVSYFLLVSFVPPVPAPIYSFSCPSFHLLVQCIPSVSPFFALVFSLYVVINYCAHPIVLVSFVVPSGLLLYPLLFLSFFFFLSLWGG